MSRLLGDLCIIGGVVFIIVMAVNDTSAFINDLSLINLAVRTLLSSVIFTVLVCVGNKLINFSYSINAFQTNFIEDILRTADISYIIGICIGISVSIHILFPIVAVIFDTVSGISEFVDKISG